MIGLPTTSAAAAERRCWPPLQQLGFHLSRPKSKDRIGISAQSYLEASLRTSKDADLWHCAQSFLKIGFYDNIIVVMFTLQTINRAITLTVRSLSNSATVAATGSTKTYLSLPGKVWHNSAIIVNFTTSAGWVHGLNISRIQNISVTLAPLAKRE